MGLLCFNSVRGDCIGTVERRLALIYMANNKEIECPVNLCLTCYVVWKGSGIKFKEKL